MVSLVELLKSRVWLQFLQIFQEFSFLYLRLFFLCSRNGRVVPTESRMAEPLARRQSNIQINCLPKELKITKRTHSFASTKWNANSDKWFIEPIYMK